MKIETIETHTSEYSVKDCCIAIYLSGDRTYFAEEIIAFDSFYAKCLPRCGRGHYTVEGKRFDLILMQDIVKITVGIYPRE